MVVIFMKKKNILLFSIIFVSLLSLHYYLNYPKVLPTSSLNKLSAHLSLLKKNEIFFNVTSDEVELWGGFSNFTFAVLIFDEADRVDQRLIVNVFKMREEIYSPIIKSFAISILNLEAIEPVNNSIISVHYSTQIIDEDLKCLRMRYYTSFIADLGYRPEKVLVKITYRIYAILNPFGYIPLKQETKQVMLRVG